MDEWKKDTCESPIYIVSAACCLGTQKNKEEKHAVIFPIQLWEIYGFIFKMAHIGQDVLPKALLSSGKD